MRACSHRRQPRRQGSKDFTPQHRYSGAQNQEQRASLMANKTNAKKAIRVIARRTDVNKNRRSRMRSFLRKVEDAISAGDQASAAAALRAAQPQVMRSAQKGLLHKNTASRKISRLSSRIKAMTA